VWSGQRALRDEVLAKVGQEQLIDVRSPEGYRGERPAPGRLPQGSARAERRVQGHMPGAEPSGTAHRFWAVGTRTRAGAI
jgi:3-mercaptopyruvate sulfurtransferase SseA